MKSFSNFLFLLPSTYAHRFTIATFFSYPVCECGRRSGKKNEISVCEREKVSAMIMSLGKAKGSATEGIGIG